MSFFQMLSDALGKRVVCVICALFVISQFLGNDGMIPI